MVQVTAAGWTWRWADRCAPQTSRSANESFGCERVDSLSVVLITFASITSVLQPHDLFRQLPASGAHLTRTHSLIKTMVNTAACCCGHTLSRVCVTWFNLQLDVSSFTLRALLLDFQSDKLVQLLPKSANIGMRIPWYVLLIGDTIVHHHHQNLLCHS